MTKYEEVYKKLKQDHTDEEIADAMIISDGEPSEEDRKALMEHRLKYWRDMGWKKRIYWKFKMRYLSYKFRFQDYMKRFK